jgi:signal transduction histidine kinase
VDPLAVLFLVVLGSTTGLFEPFSAWVDDLLQGQVGEAIGLDVLDQRSILVQTEPLTVPVDAPKIERIVENRVMNAVRHTAPRRGDLGAGMAAGRWPGHRGRERRARRAPRAAARHLRAGSDRDRRRPHPRPGRVSGCR